MSFLKEFLGYILSSKKFLLIPIFIILIGIGALFIFAQGSILAPFIYTLF